MRCSECKYYESLSDTLGWCYKIRNFVFVDEISYDQYEPCPYLVDDDEEEKREDERE